MAETLHIISFDIPYPPDYGGVIDVMNKLKALSDKGSRIHLHCFYDERPPASELERYCSSVRYYERDNALSQHFGRTPYIVKSRRSNELKQALLEEPGVLLFEGLHTCHLLSDPELQGYPKWVRPHNIEHEYYRGLKLAESSFLKRCYFSLEARKLERFEPILEHADLILPISQKEAEHFERYAPTLHLPPFHPFEGVPYEGEEEDFALYHGNLSVPENQRAVRYLLDEVFTSEGPELRVAGGKIPHKLLERIHAHPKARFEEIQGKDGVRGLLRKAKVNVLPTFQATGIKLKLLAALFEGKHCVVNPAMVEGTGLESACIVAETAQEMREAIGACMERPFEKEERESRNALLKEHYDNEKNAELLLKRPELSPAQSPPRT